LRDQPEWTLDRIRSAMEGEDNRRVNLSQPIPVCIVYTTASAREDGEVYFYPDIYGLDTALDRLIRKGYPYPK
jgi:murein L,D-transpeptidase YcbB/YkuD